MNLHYGPYPVVDPGGSKASELVRNQLAKSSVRFKDHCLITVGSDSEDEEDAILEIVLEGWTQDRRHDRVGDACST